MLLDVLSRSFYFLFHWCSSLLVISCFVLLLLVLSPSLSHFLVCSRLPSFPFVLSRFDSLFLVLSFTFSLCIFLSCVVSPFLVMSRFSRLNRLFLVMPCSCSVCLVLSHVVLLLFLLLSFCYQFATHFRVLSRCFALCLHLILLLGVSPLSFSFRLIPSRLSCSFSVCPGLSCFVMFFIVLSRFSCLFSCCLPIIFVLPPFLSRFVSICLISSRTFSMCLVLYLFVPLFPALSGCFSFFIILLHAFTFRRDPSIFCSSSI